MTVNLKEGRIGGESAEKGSASQEKVSSPASLSHSSVAAGDSVRETAANLPARRHLRLWNNDDGGRETGDDREAGDESQAITDSTATMTLDDEDSLDDVTEGLETRADDDDEFQDVVSHVQDKVSQIMGVNLTNVSIRCSLCPSLS